MLLTRGFLFVAFAEQRGDLHAMGIGGESRMCCEKRDQRD
jgi:hypothetical protein